MRRQALGNRGFADASLTHQQRVVLAAAAQDLDRALDLVVASDQRSILPSLAAWFRFWVYCSRGDAFRCAHHRPLRFLRGCQSWRALEARPS